MKVAGFKSIQNTNQEQFRTVKVITVDDASCKIRELPKFQVLSNDFDLCKQQYKEYISTFSSTMQISTSSPEYKVREKIINFFRTNKDNFYKNLIYAFQRHIKTCTDPSLVNLYESMTIDQWEFIHIQDRVVKNLKDCNRYALKLKNLIANKNLKTIFIHFLNNANEYWLSESKIKDREQYEEFIKLFLKAIDLGILSQYIIYYNKQNKR